VREEHREEKERAVGVVRARRVCARASRARMRTRAKRRGGDEEDAGLRPRGGFIGPRGGRRRRRQWKA
jgi:hypothetical protein